MDKIKQVVKQIILNLRYVLSTPSTIALLLFMVVGPFAIPLFFLPLRYSFSVLMILSVVMPTGIMYVATSYNIRESILYKNMATTKNNKVEFYISGFSFMLIVAFSLLIIVYLSLMILSSLGWLMVDYAWSGDAYGIYKYEIWRLPLIPLVYTTFESVLILFSVCFLFQNLISTRRSMYMLIFSIMVLGVIFGGSFNSYFLRGQIDPNDPYTTVPTFKPQMFPVPVYFVSLFYPLFGPSQHYVSLVKTIFVDTRNDTLTYLKTDDFQFFSWLFWKNSTLSFWGNQSWNILWFMPYIWTAIMGVLGSIASRYIEH